MPLLAQNVTIPDSIFLYALIDVGVDTNEDSLISFSEAEAVTNLDVSNDGSTEKINSMQGIEAFIHLDTLFCGGNNLDSLNLSMNLSLRYAHCRKNRIKNLIVDHCTLLEYLHAGNNSLRSVMLTDNVALNHLNLSHNVLTFIDVSANTALEHLNFGSLTNNNLPSLDISKNVLLKYLDCSGSRLTSLDISNNSSLNYLYCNQNDITALDVSNNKSLLEVSCYQNDLTALDFSNNYILFKLFCESNKLTSLKVHGPHIIAPYLDRLYCSGNQLTSLDLSGVSGLSDLRIKNMPSLGGVCVWELPFPTSGLRLDTTGSPNVYFTDNCEAIGIQSNLQTKISIFPNPFTDLITIELAGLRKYEIKITSTKGQLVQAFHLDGSRLELDLSTYTKGIYFITVSFDESVITKRIVKL